MADGAVAADSGDAPADRIAFLGHSSSMIETGGARLLTDPLLRGRVAHLRRHVPPVRLRALAGPHAVLISHLHQDHLDLPSLRLLGRDTPIVVPVGAGRWLERRGFSAVRELAPGEGLSLDARDLTPGEALSRDARVEPVTVTAVRAVHDGRRRPLGPRAPSLGYVVRGSSSVYFAGDTELFAEMAELAPALDVALLPVAGWGATLGAGHMGPLDAARAATLLKPRIAIPIHWGTLAPIGLGRRMRRGRDRPPREFARQLARLAPAVEVRILEPGKEISLSPRTPLQRRPPERGAGEEQQQHPRP